MDLVRSLYTMHYSNWGMVRAGELYPADDPLVVAHPDWFSADLEPIVCRTGPPVTPKKRRATATQELEPTA